MVDLRQQWRGFAKSRGSRGGSSAQGGDRERERWARGGGASEGEGSRGWIGGEVGGTPVEEVAETKA